MKSNIAHIRIIPFHYLLVFSFYHGIHMDVVAQNLVPNPGFEEYVICPFWADAPGPMPCEPWVSFVSENYFNACAPFPSGVPVNFQGYQHAHQGEGYVGGYLKGGNEWATVRLNSALVAGQCYELSFWANLANDACGMDRIGALLTPDPFSWDYFPSIPQLDGSGQFFSDTVNWFQLYTTFIATGTEGYLTIGNFYPSSQTQFDPNCHPDPVFAYYYFDDVVLQEIETFPIEVDLGGPHEGCNFIVLDPGLSNVNYVWSDGSTASTLTVTESGTYSVVVSAPGCNGGVATTEVTILGSPYVDLGPDLSMCAGENYTITLDASAGNYIWNTGSDDNELTISNPGTYSVTLDDGCDITWDEIIITGVNAPDFTLGDDFILCPGETFEYQFNPEMGDFVWQDNSNLPSYAIDEAGIYALTVTNACGEYSDEIDITSIDPPAFTLGPDSVILCTGDSIVLNLDESMGTFQWQDGSDDPFYTILSTGIYSLTVTNFCGTQADQFFVNEIIAPFFDLGISLQLCPGENAIIDPGDFYGTYQWQDGSNEHEYNVTTQGIYSLTVTNDCGTFSDLITVDIEPDIVPVNLGPDVTLCPGTGYVLEINQPNGNIQWSDFSTGNTLEVNTSGIYFVDISTYCESYSDTIAVVIEANPPDVDLPDNFSLCEGESTILTTGITNAQYLWNDGSQLPELNVLAPGIYSVTVTTPCGADNDSVLISNGGLAPIVSLGLDTAICSNTSIEIVPAFSNVNSWTWMDGSASPAFLATSAGAVMIEVRNDCGVAYDTIMIYQLPDLPILSLGADTAICPGQSVTISIHIPDVDILWQDGSMDTDYLVADSTIVIASITNQCGISFDSLQVSLLPDIPSLDLGADQTLCPGELITISPEIMNVNYVWHDGSTSTEYSTTSAEEIILIISNECGFETDSLIITESTQGPQIDLGPDQHACEGTSLVIDAGMSGVTFTWQDGSMLDHFIADASGMFILTVSNACGSDTDTIEIDISGLPPQTSLGEDTILCVGSMMVLSADTDDLTSSTWQDGFTGDAYAVTASGLYSLTETNICGTDSDTIEVNFSGSPPITSLGSDTVLCEGTSLVLFANADPSISILWQDGSTVEEYIVQNSGTYILTKTNACGSDNDTIEVLFNGLIPNTALGPDTILCEGNTLTLSSTSDPDIISTWQDGSSLPVFLVTIPGLYFLHEQNQCGESIDSINVGFELTVPYFSLGPDTTLCPDKSLLLIAPEGLHQIEWQNGSEAISFLVNQPGVYTLTLSNNCGMASDAIEISYDEDLIILPSPQPSSICEGQEIILDVTQLISATYMWSTGSELPIISIITPGTYTITVFTRCQEAAEEYLITTSDVCGFANDFYIPNVITPNGDQVNDAFVIYPNPEIEILSLEGNIFDRWGNMVYTSTENPFIWNGEFDEKEVLSGVYVYSLIIRFQVKGLEFTERLTGDVTIVR